jgi:hypothetical protein
VLSEAACTLAPMTLDGYIQAEAGTGNPNSILWFRGGHAFFEVIVVPTTTTTPGAVPSEGRGQ